MLGGYEAKFFEKAIVYLLGSRGEVNGDYGIFVTVCQELCG
jgi:hypothetical protein